MPNKVSVLCYAYGNVVDRDNGVGYDMDPVKAITVDVIATYDELLDKMCRCLRINTDTNEVELSHRLPLVEVGRSYYVLLPIKDEHDVEHLLSFAQNMGPGKVVQVFLNVRSGISPPDTSAKRKRCSPSESTNTTDKGTSKLRRHGGDASPGFRRSLQIARECSSVLPMPW